MGKTAVVHARLEPSTKEKAETVLKKLGMSPTEAIRIFYNQIALRKGLPFNIVVPNATTKKTLNDSRAGKNIIKHDSLNDMFESWEN